MPRYARINTLAMGTLPTLPTPDGSPILTQMLALDGAQLPECTWRGRRTPTHEVPDHGTRSLFSLISHGSDLDRGGVPTVLPVRGGVVGPHRLVHGGVPPTTSAHAVIGPRSDSPDSLPQATAGDVDSSDSVGTVGWLILSLSGVGQVAYTTSSVKRQTS